MPARARVMAALRPLGPLPMMAARGMANGIPDRAQSRGLQFKPEGIISCDPDEQSGLVL
jgi:hypothetical protein